MTAAEPPPADRSRSPAAWRQALLPFALLLILGNLWGFAFSLAKAAATAGVPPLAYAFWQSLGGGLVVLAVCLWRRQPPRMVPRYLRYYAVTGLCGIVLPNVNMLMALAHTPAGVMSIVVTVVPLLTYAYALPFGLERFDAARAAGILLGFAGAMVLVLPRGSLPSPEMTGWVLVSFLTPVLYAITNVYSAAARPPGSASMPLACGMLLTAAAAIAPVMWASGSFHPLWPPSGPGEWAVLGQICVTSVAFILFFEIQRLSGPVYLSQVAYVVCLAGVFWGFIFFAEVHSLWVWGAGALILAGLALLNLRRRPDRSGG